MSGTEQLDTFQPSQFADGSDFGGSVHIDEAEEGNRPSARQADRIPGEEPLSLNQITGGAKRMTRGGDGLHGQAGFLYLLAIGQQNIGAIERPVGSSAHAESDCLAGDQRLFVVTQKQAGFRKMD